MTDGAALSCLVGPAGTGKTRTIATAANIWRTAGFTVRGVAVSAVAADVMSVELGAPADTVAKLLWEQRRPTIDPRYRIGRGEVWIVDEASMVSTQQFVALCRLAESSEAKIVAVGDYRQLGAVDAGGMFQLLARDRNALELTGAWRFRNDWEKTATIRLRHGDTTIVDTYQQHGRLVRGNGMSTLDDMVQRWVELTDSGRTVVMLASCRDDVAAQSALARRHLTAAGVVEADGLEIGGQTIGVGDQIVTLRNERRLLTDRGRWVRNGDRWSVTNLHPDGAMTVTSGTRGKVTVPAGYTAAEVALGYALTVHKAQGVTVDHSLLLVDDTTSAEGLYVGMTRGRELNEAHIRCDHADDDHLDVFRGAVGRDATEHAALDHHIDADTRTPEQRRGDLVARVRAVIGGAEPDNPSRPDISAASHEPPPIIGAEPTLDFDHDIDVDL